MNVTQRDINNNAILTKRDRRHLHMSLDRRAAYSGGIYVLIGLLVGFGAVYLVWDIDIAKSGQLAVVVVCLLGGVAAVLLQRENIDANREALLEKGLRSYIDREKKIQWTNIKTMLLLTSPLVMVLLAFVIKDLLASNYLSLEQWVLLLLISIVLACFAYKIYDIGRWLRRLSTLTEDQIRQAVPDIVERAPQ